MQFGRGFAVTGKRGVEISPYLAREDWKLSPPQNGGFFVSRACGFSFGTL